MSEIYGETAKYIKVRKTTLYKIVRGSKISVLKIEFEKDNKVIICVFYNPARKIYSNRNPLDSLLEGDGIFMIRSKNSHSNMNRLRTIPKFSRISSIFE